MALVNDNPVAVELPVLVRVTVRMLLDCPTAVLPKDSAAGAVANAGVGLATPVPVSRIGIEAPPPVTLYVATSVMAETGAYEKTSVHVAPALSVAAPQLPDLLNFAGAPG